MQKKLSNEEIKAILRAADEIIGEGGRSLLAKILKGSRDKKVLQFGLDKCPVYGYFRSETIDEITKKVDWMIDYDFLTTEYSGRLPLIYFTERGWLIEMNQRAGEFLTEWKEWLEQGETSPDMSYLKDRNRDMILLFLAKVKETGDKRLVPYLRLWEKMEYKKVRAEIQSVVEALETGTDGDTESSSIRKKAINEALEGEEPGDLLIKCWECGDRFLFTVEEQRFFKEKGFVPPKRCEDCRNQRYEF